MKYLSGLRVLELGQIVSGPMAGLILANLGAEVLKIEKPNVGDSLRNAPITSHAFGSFSFFNMGKKSVCIDLTQAEGREIFLKLVPTADVVIENMAPGTMERYKIDSKVLRGIKPDLLFASIKGFIDGPYQERLAMDEPMEALGGLSYMTGLEGRPMRVGASLIDIGAATYCVLGILLQLLAREKKKEVRNVTVGMFETISFWMGQHMAYACASGKAPLPLNTGIFKWAVYNYFQTLDQKTVFIGITSEKQWKELCSRLELDLGSMNEEERMKKRDSVLGTISDAIGKLSLEQVETLLWDAKIPWAKLNTPADLFNDPHLRGKLKTFKSLIDGVSYSLPLLPVSGSSVDLPPPRLGEHTLEVMLSLGLGKERIMRLAKQGVLSLSST